MLSRLRAVIRQADPDVVEEWKWRGAPVWSHDGLICTGETYKNVVKMPFSKAAALEDPGPEDRREGSESSYSRGRDAERVPQAALAFEVAGWGSRA
jgi:hypothetical protein